MADITNNTFAIPLAHEMDTKEVARVLARVTPASAWYYFSGNLGVGKSTFIRAFLRDFGVTGAIRSPTFTLVESYATKTHAFYHLDCYRLESPDELLTIGIRDYFGSESVCCVEWPEKGGGVLPTPDCQFLIEMTGNSRQLTIESCSERGELILNKFISLMNQAK